MTPNNYPEISCPKCGGVNLASVHDGVVKVKSYLWGFIKIKEQGFNLSIIGYNCNDCPYLWYLEGQDDTK